MQTFLPFADLTASCQVLDDRRLGKQRVEVFQVLRALTWPDYAWKSHPAVRMWRGFVPGLVAYGVACCREWTRRGYADAVLPQLLAWTGGEVPVDPELPPWFGVEELHRSHRASLVRKDAAHYLPLLGPHADEGYLWPPDTYPRWPVRRGGAALSPDAAASLLGHPSARPEQVAAADAVASGRDVLAVLAPGAGGRALGLVAALGAAGSALWRSPRPGTPAGPVPRVPLVAWREVAPAGPAPVLAREPSPAARLAALAEAEPTGLVFRGTGAVPSPGTGLVVDAVTTRGWPEPLCRRWTGPVPARAHGGPPVLLLAERADADQRAALAERHGLRDPLRVGAGWDVAASLEVRGAPTPAARRDALVELVAQGRPALVVCGSRDRADRVVTLLGARGLRAASWDASMRPSRAAEAVAAWRSRRLAALVVGPLPGPAGEPVPLGRVRPALVVHADPPEDALAWRADVAALAPSRAALLVPPGAGSTLRLLLDARCVRETLLDPLGEPVAVPCGRCSACGSVPPYPPEPAAGVTAGAAAAS